MLDEVALQELMYKHFGIQNFSYTVLSQKSQNVVYKIRVHKKYYIMRFSTQNSIVKNNFSTLKMLKGMSNFVKPLKFFEEENYSISLEEYIFAEKFEEVDEITFRNFLHVVNKIHSITNKNCGYFDNLKLNYTKFLHDSYLANYEKDFVTKVPGIGYDIVLLIKDNLSQNSDFYSLLHGNFISQNFVFDENKNYFLVNFENSHYGEKEFDIGNYLFKEKIIDSSFDDIIEEHHYNLKKVYLYALAVGIEAVVNSKTNREQIDLIKFILEFYEKVKEM